MNNGTGQVLNALEHDVTIQHLEARWVYKPPTTIQSTVDIGSCDPAQKRLEDELYSRIISNRKDQSGLVAIEDRILKQYRTEARVEAMGLWGVPGTPKFINEPVRDIFRAQSYSNSITNLFNDARKSAFTTTFELASTTDPQKRTDTTLVSSNDNSGLYYPNNDPRWELCKGMKCGGNAATNTTGERQGQ